MWTGLLLSLKSLWGLVTVMWVVVVLVVVVDSR